MERRSEDPASSPPASDEASSAPQPRPPTQRRPTRMSRGHLPSLLSPLPLTTLLCSFFSTRGSPRGFLSSPARRSLSDGFINGDLPLPARRPSLSQHTRGQLRVLRAPLAPASVGPSVDEEMGRGDAVRLGLTTFRRRAMLDTEDSVSVNIERPAANVRRISGSVIVDTSMEDCWSILTDYDNLAAHVPNLVVSQRVPLPRSLASSGLNGDDMWQMRLYQEGAQKIIGFDFRAAVTMDMREVLGDPENRMAPRLIEFKLADSQFFSQFDGEWKIQAHTRRVRRHPATGDDEISYTTKLFYVVTVRPKGPVPVMALEWRIKEDVPTNLKAVKQAAEKIARKVPASSPLLLRADEGETQTWRREGEGEGEDDDDMDEVDQGVQEDETLGVYMRNAPDETLDYYVRGAR
ncbi:unnamed protein product [Vitrella brassicaformis CCMP3155]|uniref:Coenzyme Q-binding protein COQ10 START domain-containing protein n=1 Tax=Vitrella brassicaformis (strain CCMP3155) TaxID=1169540 RepID=A0A0G4H7W0_VITBC|nr:unnamed protein product [Vitrella brassicaformis CCMP3155]|eukprot:CEM39765.1 unnamed protein product [Vitrella brassicaformis CCMP3155]